ncbi:MAG: hypothetical protein B6I36_10020 [Desulfobacteraceae bacterium 4572_35.1]|nr:MAG: hypothetical protein B6I36_10020 [Desulfobacteraceae bacterium 4572_35.1]
MLELRPYQKRVCQSVWEALESGENALLQGPTAMGKSCIVAAVSNKLINVLPSGRVLILVDREILVSQLRDSISRFYPGLSIGVICAGVSAKKQLDCQLTIASRQTIVNCLDEFAPVNLLILDEAHLVNPTREGKKLDQYGVIIERLKEYNDNMRLFGCSATPYRLNNGFIYGNKHHPADKPYFNNLTEKVTFAELTDNGFLCPLKGEISNNQIDLSSVAMVAGDYNLGQLSTVMGLHIDTIQEAIDIHAYNRNKIMVFCVDIKHAEKVATATGGVSYHSKLLKKERAGILTAFKKNQHRVICSVATLTTGFDDPGVDCIIMARPTKSPALFVQMVGRGLRINKGKEDCLLIDLTGNTKEHTPTNSLDNVHVTIPKGGGGEGEAPYKICPGLNNDDTQCLEEVHPKCCICPECGFRFETEIAAALPDTQTVNFSEPFIKKPAMMYSVLGMETTIHESAAGKKLLRIEFLLDTLEQYNTVSDWICLADEYSGYAVTMGIEKWGYYSDEQCPDETEAAFWLSKDFNQPNNLECTKTEKGYFEIEKRFFTKNVDVPNTPEMDLDEIPF